MHEHVLRIRGEQKEALSIFGTSNKPQVFLEVAGRLCKERIPVVDLVRRPLRRIIQREPSPHPPGPPALVIGSKPRSHLRQFARRKVAQPGSNSELKVCRRLSSDLLLLTIAAHHRATAAKSNEDRPAHG